MTPDQQQSVPFEATNAKLGRDLNLQARELYVQGDLKRARAVFERGAILGDAGAQYNLGVMYLAGKGGPESWVTAKRLFQQAAEQGHAEAQCDLAALLRHKWLGPTDPDLAMHWLLRSANQGYVVAQFNAGEMYANGVRGVVDIVEAYKWFSLAATQGMAMSAVHRYMLERWMSPEDYSVAFHRISEFVPTPERPTRLQ